MSTPSPAIDKAIAQINAMFDERDAIKARIDADSRIIWLRKVNAELWQPTESADDFARQINEGRIVRQRRVMELIRARRAQFNNFPSVVRKHLREAAVCRRQYPHQNTASVGRQAA